ncbi:glycosyltransferase [Streptomyces sioyaensis]|uniref:glycosyltransferase family 2 protein n=1 Tax=Streptomyces sioyaensis TaxID=67364 RepID=UPI0033EAB70E
MPPTQIAVLITCHNRREKTLAALAALEGQQGLSNVALRTYLVDAGSTDGTPEAVRHAHPQIDIVRAGSHVFWGEGMRTASARSCDPDQPRWDYQLWLNDDVLLAQGAVAILLATAQAVGPVAVVVGAVREHGGSRTTYSGRIGPSLNLVKPTGRPEPCATYNGNVVLISRRAYQRVGDIDKAFRHSIGDYDHGIRARKAGVPAYVAPHHVGWCDRNHPGGSSRERGIGVREAMRRVVSQRELPPRQWWTYCLRHNWPWAPALMVSPYVKTAVRAMVQRSSTADFPTMSPERRM